MKSKIYAFAVLCMGVLMLSSCLKSNTDEVTYYEDTAITSFSLGTLNRYIQTTTKAGVDTVIKTTLNAGSYKFNIDQRNRVIYNPDSLPKGVDATKVVINMTSKNSGALFINKRTKDKMRDSLVYYSSNDSLDFTQPLEIRAFNNSGTAYRSYRVSVNVHKEDANVLNWQSVNGLDHLVASMKGLRALAYDGKMWFMGNDGTGSRVYVGDYDDKQLIWTLALEDVFDADAYRNFVFCCGYPMFLSNGKIYIIKKAGVGYEATAIDAPNISLLLGGAYQSVYAYSKNGQLMESSYMSEVWKEVEMDRDREWLPTEDVNFVSLTSKTNDDVCKLVLLGNRNAQQFAGETNAVIWSLVDETSTSGEKQPWTFYTVSPNSRQLLPRMKNLQVISYNNMLLAIGQNVIDASVSGGAVFYQSKNEGIAWQRDTVYAFPKDFTVTGSAFTVTTDENNYIWILAAETGEVWKGRLNELGWRKEQGAFEE